ncbi:hypothetical protein DM40_2203 [Burkholderia cenocepacia]|nr:hypothetical protein [Burkholderia latens]AIO40576.1 hypothetical protein DM40_2203 [Burkholderia cenocepacia]
MQRRKQFDTDIAAARGAERCAPLPAIEITKAFALYQDVAG